MNKKEITIIEESLFMLNVNIGLIYVIIVIIMNFLMIYIIYLNIYCALY